jgi:proline iminopeptidase
VRERLAIPALVIHGREDPIPLASSEAVAQALGAPLVVIDGAGHVPYVERPEELFGAIEEFLSGTRDSGLGTRAS